ncbi:MAG: hypothetical protein J7M40_20160 [Planctomycetes bacterium]|nr:hypothetical protein [Planctomycetota bacterium]
MLAIWLELIAANGAITVTDFAADATGSAPVSLAAGNGGASGALRCSRK